MARTSVWILGVCVVGLGLAACKSRDAVPRHPEGFVDVMDTIERACVDPANVYECARSVEQYRLGKGVEGVRRMGKRLALSLRDGRVLDLTDSADPAAPDYVAYAYTEYLGCLGYHLIHRQGGADAAYTLVQAEHGTRIELAGVPVLSPDCQRLAVTAGVPADQSFLQVWRLQDTGKLSLESGYEPDTPWSPGLPIWESTVQLSVRYTSEDDPGTVRRVRARLFTDGWRIEP